MFLLLPVVMTDDFHSLRLKLLGLSGAHFLLHLTSLLKKAKKLVCLRIYRYLCTSKEILSTKGASSDARMFFSFFKCMFSVFRRDDGIIID